jgi:hypothetical protein
MTNNNFLKKLIDLSYSGITEVSLLEILKLHVERTVESGALECVSFKIRLSLSIQEP